MWVKKPLQNICLHIGDIVIMDVITCYIHNSNLNIFQQGFTIFFDKQCISAKSKY